MSWKKGLVTRNVWKGEQYELTQTKGYLSPAGLFGVCFAPQNIHEDPEWMIIHLGTGASIVMGKQDTLRDSKRVVESLERKADLWRFKGNVDTVRNMPIEQKVILKEEVENALEAIAA